MTCKHLHTQYDRSICGLCHAANDYCEDCGADVTKHTCEDSCHCGQPVHYGYDGNPEHTRGLCSVCDAVRCDAYPGACRDEPTDEDRAERLARHRAHTKNARPIRWSRGVDLPSGVLTVNFHALEDVAAEFGVDLEEDR